MATAAVISFEKTLQSFAKARAHQQMHAYLDRWMDSVEATMPEDAPSLEELTQAVFALRQELTGKIIETLVAQRHAQGLHQRTLPWPHCQRLLPARPAPPRTVHPLVGEVSLSRPYFYCPQCQQGFTPLDDALQLSERRTQWDLQQAAARLAAEVPFATAQELFTQLTGLSLSDHTIHTVAGELTQELGVLDVSPPAPEVARRVAEMAAGKTWRPVMVLAIDGAFVPTRPEQAKREATGRRRTRAKRAGWQGEWKEAKGFRFYLVDKERIVHLLSWYQVARDEDMGAALQCVKDAGLIPEDQVRLCVIGDGAKWIWNQGHALFPTAVQILDYYHCSAHMHTVGHLQFSEDAVQEQEWVEAMMARLFWGYVDWAIEGLAALQPCDHQTAEEIRKLIGFLQNNAERLHYRTARKGGYPIGSGGIEAANKSISHVRLKRSGAWWYLEQANHMLALRCAIYNGTFPQAWPAYNAAQTHEKEKFQTLLYDLCQGLEELPPSKGHPRLSLSDAVFAACFKVYSTMSARRFISVLRDAQVKGYLRTVPHFNSILNYLDNPILTPILRALITESSLPLKTVEADFAVDSSGFTTSRFIRWFDHKYGVVRQQHAWVKVHLMCGVKTNVVTAVEIREKDASDTKLLPDLVNTTAQHFDMREVSADKGYSSVNNTNVIASHGATPYIAFKSIHSGAAGGLWEKMFHYFAFNRQEFMAHYHKRSNVESTFSMIKAKFRDHVRTKTDVAMTNEVLCKILCHNICCVIQAMYELGIQPAFWGQPSDERISPLRDTAHVRA